MGKGDKRSRRGKIFAGSFGKTRPKAKTPAFVPVEKPAAAPVVPVVKEKPKPKVRKKAAAVEAPAAEEPATIETPAGADETMETPAETPAEPSAEE